MIRRIVSCLRSPFLDGLEFVRGGPKLSHGPADLAREHKLTVFLVEHNAVHALKLAHRGYVMVKGLITLFGLGQELLARPEVRAAYLEGGRH